MRALSDDAFAFVLASVEDKSYEDWKALIGQTLVIDTQEDTQEYNGPFEILVLWDTGRPRGAIRVAAGFNYTLKLFERERMRSMLVHPDGRKQILP